MSRVSMICLPAFALLAACNSGPGNGTSQTESAAVAGGDGTVAAPDAASDTDGSNAGVSGSTTTGAATGGGSASNTGPSGSAGASGNAAGGTATNGARTGGIPPPAG